MTWAGPCNVAIVTVNMNKYKYYYIRQKAHNHQYHHCQHQQRQHHRHRHLTVLSAFSAEAGEGVDRPAAAPVPTFGFAWQDGRFSFGEPATGVFLLVTAGENRPKSCEFAIEALSSSEGSSSSASLGRVVGHSDMLDPPTWLEARPALCNKESNPAESIGRVFATTQWSARALSDA